MVFEGVAFQRVPKRLGLPWEAAGLEIRSQRTWGSRPHPRRARRKARHPPPKLGKQRNYTKQGNHCWLQEELPPVPGQTWALAPPWLCLGRAG